MAVPREEFEDYSRTVHDYDSTREPVGADPLLALLGEREALSLLDLGCGTGNYLARLAPKMARADGIDCSPAMLERCAAKMKALGLEHVRLTQGSILGSLPFPDDTYDVVAVNQVLHHVDTPDDHSGSAAVVREAFRTLKPGGLFWVSHCEPAQSLLGLWWSKLIPRAAVEYGKRQISRAGLERLCTDAGFLAVSSEVGYEPLQGAAYYNLTGPLSAEFRAGDSMWSMATPEEIAGAGETVRGAMRMGGGGRLFDAYDASRLEVGQGVLTRGWKPARPQSAM